MSEYRVGEIVDITIKGARIMAPKPGISDVLTLAYEEVEPGVFATIELRHPRAGSVTLERSMPAEWPPQAGDVWKDRQGVLFFAADSGSRIHLCSEAGSFVSCDYLRSEYSPLTLEYRRPDGEQS